MTSNTLLREISDGLSALAGTAGASVVQVRPRHARPATGTVVGNARVLTAAHAVEPGDGLTVNSEGRSFPARILGADSSTNLALLSVDGLTQPALPAADTVRVGQLAVSLGRTMSGALAVSAGVVSVVGGPLRTGRGPAIEQVVRADLRPHPLGAGGPLLDVSGAVAGIATGAHLRGLPLFIPGTAAWRVAEVLAQHGRIKRGYLGVSAQPIRIPANQRAGGGAETGLLVLGTAADSPAEKAGVLVGDLIVGFDGQPVRTHDDLLALLTGERVGRTVPLDVIRGGALETAKVQVAEHA